MQTYPICGHEDYDEYYEDVVRQAYEELMWEEERRAKADALNHTEWEDEQ